MCDAKRAVGNGGWLARAPFRLHNGTVVGLLGLQCIELGSRTPHTEGANRALSHLFLQEVKERLVAQIIGCRFVQQIEIDVFRTELPQAGGERASGCFSIEPCLAQGLCESLR
ncbi:hypothetical protein GCM10022270_14770 [Terriglobus aquaticus]